MSKRQQCRMAVDLAMTALLLILMAYPITGQLAHEWVGAAMFVLFIAHHALNGHWHKNLGRGNYNGLRIVQTAVDVLLLADMLALMVSGIQLSRYVFSFLPVFGSAALARRVHLLASYWGFVLMSVHLGLHWGMVTGMIRKMTGRKKSVAGSVVAWGIAGVIGIYGVYALWRQQIWRYLFLRGEFLNFDPAQPTVAFCLNHLAIMGLFVLLTYGVVCLLRQKKENRV